jgi:hypothetical protein
MKETDVRQGTLALMVLKTLDILGPSTDTESPGALNKSAGSADGQSGDALPSSAQAGAGRFHRLRMGSVLKTTAKHASTSSHGRGARQLQAEARSWEQTAAIIERFFAAKAQNLK